LLPRIEAPIDPFEPKFALEIGAEITGGRIRDSALKDISLKGLL